MNEWSQNIMGILIKYSIVIFTIFFVKNAIAYETTTTGEAFSTTKDGACSQAIDRARESAAQEARVFVSSKYEKRIKQLSGEVVEDVTSETYQSTFGITELTKMHKKESSYDPESGRVNCSVKATFVVDMDAVKKELEARIRVEEVKLEEAEKRKALLNKIEINEIKYVELERNATKYKVLHDEYTVICKTKYSMDECRKDLVDKFKNKTIDTVASDLNISDKYISVDFESFDGESKQRVFNEDENAFAYTMNGTFYYTVNISDPFASENSIMWRQLNKDVYKEAHVTVMEDKDISSGVNNTGSNAVIPEVYDRFYVDIRLVGGDIIDTYQTFLSVGESAAYNGGLLELGVVLNFGNAYDANLFRLFYTTGEIILHQCTSVVDSECVNDDSYIYDTVGFGLDKIFIVSKRAEISLGAAYLTAKRSGFQLETKYLQLQVGVTMFPLTNNENKGFSLFMGLASLVPRTSNEPFEIDASFDLTIGLGVRF